MLPRWLKPAVFILCLLPLAQLIYLGSMARLGVNPVEFVLRDLGEWALKFLLITLAVTPVRKITGWAWLMPLRRMLGLYAFFYAVLHLLVFFGADLSFDVAALWREILRRPYITVGMLALLVMLPLAITSTNGMIKRLGGARWRRLHQLVYVAGILGVLHFYWMKSSKNLTTEPLIYAAILVLLLGYRVADHYGYAPRLKRRPRA